MGKPTFPRRRPARATGGVGGKAEYAGAFSANLDASAFTAGRGGDATAGGGDGGAATATATGGSGAAAESYGGQGGAGHAPQKAAGDSPMDRSARTGWVRPTSPGAALLLPTNAGPSL